MVILDVQNQDPLERWEFEITPEEGDIVENKENTAEDRGIIKQNRSSSKDLKEIRALPSIIKGIQKMKEEAAKAAAEDD